MQDIKGRQIETTDISLAILEFIQQRDGVRIGEIAEEMDLAKSTVHGHLATLRRREYVIKNDNKYHPGLKLFNMGQSAKQRDSRFRVVEEKIRKFSDEITEEIDFSVEENGRTIVLFDEIGSSKRPGFQLGDYFYMNTNAAGKAILAEFSDTAVESVIETWGLPEETEYTITDRDALFEELEEVRKQGYAINNQGNFEGIRAVGTSILTPDEDVLGAIAISGPTYRLSVRELHDVANDVQAYAEEIEDKLQDPTLPDSPVQQRGN